MTRVISVRFNNKGKAYYFDPKSLLLKKDDYVIVETAKGLEYGQCVRDVHEVRDDAIVPPLRPVVRIATESDNEIAEANKQKEKVAFDYCVRQIAHFGLEMKLVSVECGFEGNKILFFFTSEGRVDFRELVKDLANQFRARIELRQIGVRDEAKILGGLGVCGKQFCCSQFLNDFHPVSIKMAKTQGLSLNPTKISGTCGRLMCCLKYEEHAYEDLVKKAPKVDSFVETPSGKGSVTSVNLLRGNAKVRLEDGIDTTLKTFTFDELNVLGGKGRRAEYIAARDEGRLEEAGFTPSPPPPPKFAPSPQVSRPASAPKKPQQSNRQQQSANVRQSDSNTSSQSASNRNLPPPMKNQQRQRPNKPLGERNEAAAAATAPAKNQQKPKGGHSRKPYYRRKKPNPPSGE